VRYLTPKRLRAVYEMLLAFPPFSRWNMAAPEDVTFIVLKGKEICGEWVFDDPTHQIRISKPRHAHLINVIMTMAHEMVHLHQYETGVYNDEDPHDEAFHAAAAQICDIFGFDVGQF
jgi:SprT-like family